MERFSTTLPLVVLLAVVPGCIDSTGQGRTQPAGLYWGSGASAAFVGDSIPLVTFYVDSGGRPIGAPRPAIAWHSNDSTVVRVVSDSVALALDTGSVVLTASTSSGQPFSLSVSLMVVPGLAGRMVWVRTLSPTEQPALVERILPNGETVPLPPFGASAHGRVSVASDGRHAVSYGPRPASPIADQALYLLDLVSGTSALLLDTMPGHQIWPVWLPGDTLIAFLSNRSGAWDVWTVRPDGTGARRRTDMRATRPPFFDVTPQGTLVMVRPRGDGGDLWEVTLTGDSVRRFSPSLNVWDWPSVSPDGRVIAYVAGTTDSPVLGALSQVWLVNRDGSNPRRLVPPHAVVVVHDPSPSPQIAQTLSPSWTPDGAFALVAWTVDPFLQPDGSFYATLGEIYAVRVADGRAIRLTRWKWVDAQPVFR